MTGPTDLWIGFGVSDDVIPLVGGLQNALHSIAPGQVLQVTVSRVADRAPDPEPVETERALAYKTWNAAVVLTEYRIPKHLHGGIERYLKEHIEAGGFLMAIFQNDCHSAMLRAADASAVLAVRSIVQFLTSEAPAIAWGSADAVSAWLAQRPSRPAPEGAVARG